MLLPNDFTQDMHQVYWYGMSLLQWLDTDLMSTHPCDLKDLKKSARSKKGKRIVEVAFSAKIDLYVENSVLLLVVYICIWKKVYISDVNPRCYKEKKKHMQNIRSQMTYLCKK